LKKDKTVVISLNNKGWVDTIVPAPDDESEVVEPAEPPAKEEVVSPNPAIDQLRKAAQTAEGKDKEEIVALLAKLGFE